MKFSNGAWLMAEGVKPYFASEMRSRDIKNDEVIIYAPFQSYNFV